MEFSLGADGLIYMKYYWDENKKKLAPKSVRAHSGVNLTVFMHPHY